jgi:enoyl-CoA hydratase
MRDLVSYRKTDAVAQLDMDDGKVNVMSTQMLGELLSAFDRAEQDGAVVLLTSSRQGIFSAGFDTKILRGGDAQRIYDMVRLGAELAARVLSFPLPVVVACNGHAFPMGAFLMLAADSRVGAEGPFKIGMNEVAIGIPVPSFALELGRLRMAPAYLQRTALTGEMFAPQDAMAAGFLDTVVPAEALMGVAQSIASSLSKIDFPAHASTKRRLRRTAAAAVRAAIDSEITLQDYQRQLGSSPGS